MNQVVGLMGSIVNMRNSFSGIFSTILGKQNTQRGHFCDVQNNLPQTIQFARIENHFYVFGACIYIYIYMRARVNESMAGLFEKPLTLFLFNLQIAEVVQT